MQRLGLDVSDALEVVLVHSIAKGDIIENGMILSFHSNSEVNKWV